MIFPTQWSFYNAYDHFITLGAWKPVNWIQHNRISIITITKPRLGNAFAQFVQAAWIKKSNSNNFLLFFQILNSIKLNKKTNFINLILYLLKLNKSNLN
jgi:hypothetical protein